MNSPSLLVKEGDAVLKTGRFVVPGLALRLFILRIREDKKKPTYRIAYGVIVPSDHTMEKASVSEFSQLGRYGNKVYLSFITMCFALGKGTIIYGIRRDIALLYEGEA